MKKCNDCYFLIECWDTHSNYCFRDQTFISDKKIWEDKGNQTIKMVDKEDILQ